METTQIKPSFNKRNDYDLNTIGSVAANSGFMSLMSMKNNSINNSTNNQPKDNSNPPISKPNSVDTPRLERHEKVSTEKTSLDESNVPNAVDNTNPKSENNSEKDKNIEINSLQGSIESISKNLDNINNDISKVVSDVTGFSDTLTETIENLSKNKLDNNVVQDVAQIVEDNNVEIESIVADVKSELSSIENNPKNSLSTDNLATSKVNTDSTEKKYNTDIKPEINTIDNALQYNQSTERMANDNRVKTSQSYDNSPVSEKENSTAYIPIEPIEELDKNKDKDFTKDSSQMTHGSLQEIFSNSFNNKLDSVTHLADGTKLPVNDIVHIENNNASDAIHSYILSHIRQDGTVNLQLDPKNLGKIILTMRQMHDGVSIALCCDKASTAKLLMHNISQLAGILKHHMAEPIIITTIDNAHNGNNDYLKQRQEQQGGHNREQQNQQQNENKKIEKIASNSFIDRLRLNLA